MQLYNRSDEMVTTAAVSMMAFNDKSPICAITLSIEGDFSLHTITSLGKLSSTEAPAVSFTREGLTSGVARI